MFKNVSNKHSVRLANLKSKLSSINNVKKEYHVNLEKYNQIIDISKRSEMNGKIIENVIDFSLKSPNMGKHNKHDIKLDYKCHVSFDGEIIANINAMVKSLAIVSAAKVMKLLPFKLVNVVMLLVGNFGIN